MIQTLAKRYAVALFEVTEDKEACFAELKVVADGFLATEEVRKFFLSPETKGLLKEEILKKALGSLNLSEDIKHFIFLLASKNRLCLLEELVSSYRLLLDEFNSVARAEVRSLDRLTPEEREHIQEIISDFAKKKVIVSYKEDPDIIGGVVAQVGSFTLDDSLGFHLEKLNEDINRRLH